MRGFTLIEFLVVLGIIAVLGLITAALVLRSWQVSRTSACMSNLRQIATGLAGYYDQYNSTPSFARTSLPEFLAGQIPDPHVFVCPASPQPASDSYSQFYVPCNPTSAAGFLLGCTNHRTGSLTLGAFGAGLTLKAQTKPVRWNDQPITPGGQVTGGTLTFADGTKVTIDTGLSLTALVSFEESKGQIYSAIKLPAGSRGTIQVEAAHGTHFDVATPACTVSVCGTKFTVTAANRSGDLETDVGVTDGKVSVHSIWPAPSEMIVAPGSSYRFRLPDAAARPHWLF